MNRNESDISAARRETLEEVHLTLRTLTPLGSYKNTFEYKNDTVEVFYTVLITQQEVKLRRGEIVAYEWFPKTNLPVDIAPSALMAIEMKLSLSD